MKSIVHETVSYAKPLWTVFRCGVNATNTRKTQKLRGTETEPWVFHTLNFKAFLQRNCWEFPVTGRNPRSRKESNCLRTLCY